jgi:hypothetical protein
MFSTKHVVNLLMHYHKNRKNLDFYINNSEFSDKALINTSLWDNIEPKKF